ncbi:hypothetical protein VTN77DRAFT_7970 [Rasamsonia byssochlamydoides]|uniref:uncharacterized protein n=1 Tax=Rasamsonia byssochlamydoides TaxID=89139 RepID=UPI00374308D8
MESPTVKPLSPSKTPLLPASPERMNQQKPSSPSMPADLLQKQSDVQAKIAFINGLSQAGSPAPTQQPSTSTSAASSSSNSAALQRAILGREEAESALARANAQLAEAQSRERRISERLESLLEELQATKERQAHERSLFEKEVRKARKEAFRASSTLVKIQEELKISKREVKALKEEVQSEREAKEKAKQEAFERAYALAGLTEELQSLKDQLQSLQADKQADDRSDALEARAKEMHEDSAGKLPIERGDNATTTPTPRRPKRSADESELVEGSGSGVDSGARDDETPSKKIRLSRRASNKENQDPETVESERDLIEDLKTEIKWERRLRQKAEDMVHFLKMECQFKRCSCRVAESQGVRYVHDKEWDNLCKEQQREQPAVSESTFTSSHSPPTPRERSGNEFDKGMSAPEEEEPLITFSPTTGTFRSVPSPQRGMQSQLHEEPLVLPEAPEPDAPPPRLRHSASPQNDLEGIDFQDFQAQSEMQAEEPIQPPSTIYDAPAQVAVDSAHVGVNSSEEALISPTEEGPHVVEHHSVKTVPLLPEDNQSRNPADIIPGTPLTREEALAQIRERRGRARSMMKRSASASEVRSGDLGVTPMRGSKRIPGLHHSDTRSEPDVGDRRDRDRDIGASIRRF